MTKNYSKPLKLQVAREALLPDNKSMKHVIAEKHGIMPWTVRKWKNHLMNDGQLVMGAFNDMITRGFGSPGCIIHSDICSTY